MKAYDIEELGTLKELVSQAQRASEPVIVLDGDDECLVAMRPPVFENILFNVDRLEYEGRRTVHV